MARIDYMTHYMIQSLANCLRRRQQKWNSGQMFSILAHSSLEVHCSYRLKFFVAKNHLRSSSPSNYSLLLLDHVHHALLKV